MGTADREPTDPQRNVPRRIATAKTGGTHLVIGGHGLLGSHIVEALLARGEQSIRVFDIARSDLFAAEVRAGSVTVYNANLLDERALEEACRGVDTVYHTAASVNYWSDLPFEYHAIHAVNVTGTENVIRACQRAGVRQLLSTSSTSVVVPRDVLKHPVSGVDETAPYATPPFLCHYIETKILAEQAVLAANGKDGLLTAALRPGGMYGPRDQLITPAFARRIPGIAAKETTVDQIYVENVAHAFLLLQAKLQPGAAVCGKPYGVTNYAGECEPAWEFNRRFARLFGHEYKPLPLGPVAVFAQLVQGIVRLSGGRLIRALGEVAKLRPASLTLGRATFWVTHKNATRDFGYEPIYTVDEGFEITVEHWKRTHPRH